VGHSRIPSTAQVDIFTPVNVEVGDVFTLTVTGKSGATASVSYTAQAATVADVTAGLTRPWNASTNPLVSTITAANISGTLKLTGKSIGMPFKVSSSSSNGGPTRRRFGGRRSSRLRLSRPATSSSSPPSRADGSRNRSVAYAATAGHGGQCHGGPGGRVERLDRSDDFRITAIDNGTNITLVADDSGVPFYLTGSAANGGRQLAVADADRRVHRSARGQQLSAVQGNNPDGTRNPNYPILLDVDNLIDYMLITIGAATSMRRSPTS
jgi:hypothetical protein